jgi:hypothetical protein
MVLKSLPSVTEIEYCQSLKSAILSGGEVIDSIHQQSIRGKWSFETHDAIPKNGDTVKVIFTPYNSEYGILTAEISVNVTESTPILTLNTDKNGYKGGDTVNVSATVKNKHSQSITDLPTVKFYYQINGGEKIFFDGSFTLPKDISGKKITIAAITEEIDGKYNGSTDTITFSASTSGATSSDPSKNPDTDSNNTPDSTNSTNNNTVENHTQSTESTANKNNRPPVKKGCLSSTSLSVLLVISAFGGMAILKKRKDD